MALEKFGFIVCGTGMKSDTHTSTMRSDGFEIITVGVSQPSEALVVAKNMVENGVQLIELCGAFGPIWTAKILEAIDAEIPIGSVGYGPESVSKMHELFSKC